jgi:glyoxylase-like metal-dependent hydrolase (beta-lactamase superfamily II)
MAQYKLAVGKAEIIALSDAVLTFQASAIFPNVPAEAWTPYTSDDTLRANVGSYVIRSQCKTILVDTGIGPGPVAGSGGAKGQMLADMQAKGVRPDEVDIVVFTHLHPDHVGWNVTGDGGRPKATFAGAKHMIRRPEWEHWTSPSVLEASPFISESVVSLKDLVDVELEEKEWALTGEISTLMTPGHTPGHLSVMINSGGQKAVVLGDVANHIAQVTHTDWSPIFDNDPGLAVQTRAALFERLRADGVTMAAGHFPTPGFGSIVMLDGRHVFQAL